MSKEEILKDSVPLYFSSDYDGPGENAEWHTGSAKADTIYKAMDQYAKQQAIAFSEWMVKCQWSPIVTSVPGPPIYAPEDSDQRYTTEQLYQLFINQNK